MNATKTRKTPSYYHTYYCVMRQRDISPPGPAEIDDHGTITLYRTRAGAERRMRELTPAGIDLGQDRAIWGGLSVHQDSYDARTIDAVIRD